MNLIIRAFVILLSTALLAQLPFVMNRYKTARLASEVERLNGKREKRPANGYRDVKGVIHVHSFAGGHSTGTYFELIDAARENSLDFVLMTEHVTDLFDSSAKSLDSRLGDTLWIGGNEVSTRDGDRFIVIEGSRDLGKLRKSSTDDFLAKMRDQGRQSLLVYPGEKWPEKVDGVEIFSLHTSAKQMNAFLFLMDALWSYGAYPELTLARHFLRPNENLEMFDRISQRKRIYLFGGNDAHSNIGFFLGDDANNRFLELKYDRYSSIFKLLRTHVLLPEGLPLEREQLLEALRRGNSYLGIDAIGDSTGFFFEARLGDRAALMGEEFEFADGEPELRVFSPLKATIAIFRNGEKVAEESGVSMMRFKPSGPGVYRTEVYFDGLGAPFDEMPWIISNPIWIRRVPGTPESGLSSGKPTL